MRRTKKYLKQIVSDIENDLSTVNRNIIRQTEEIEKQNALQKEKLDWEKETKDRVDISLKEYEKLKRDLGDLRGKLERYETIFETLKLSEYMDYIDPHSMTISTLKDPTRITTRVFIQFDCKTMLEFPFERKR